MLRSTLIAVGIVGMASAPLMAADPIRPAPAPAFPVITSPTSVHDWTGFYAGLTAGYGFVSTSAPVDNRSGFGGAIHAGYYQDFGQWVGGIHGEFAPSALTDLSVGNRSVGNAGRITARLGAKVGETGNALLYGTAGAAVVESRQGGAHYTDWGWTAGVGASYAFTDHLSVTGEVTYTRFENAAGTSYNVQGTAVTLGLSYHF